MIWSNFSVGVSRLEISRSPSRVSSAQALGLVDQEDDIVPLGVFPDQGLVNMIQERFGFLGGRLQVQLPGQGPEQPDVGKAAIEEIDDLFLDPPPLLQEGLQQGRLPQAHLAHQGHEPLALLHRVGDGRQGLPVAGAQVQEFRVGGDLEGFSLKIVKI